MNSLTKLFCETEYFGDSIRYTEDAHAQRHGTTAGHGPVVVWNITRTCNLHCIHCYSDSDSVHYAGELTTDEAMAFLQDLAGFHVPALLISGGEPLMRRDFFDLLAEAQRLGLRVTISTNGTLITPDVAKKFRQYGVSYVGISLDGIGEVNDYFRGQPGAFERALRGIRNCVDAGQRAGLRFTLNRHNYESLPGILDVIEKEHIDRACFYHLAYSGRGRGIMGDDLGPAETRAALDLLIRRTIDWHERGMTKEILTVDNHADPIYAYLWAKKHMPERAPRILELVRRNGGNRSGIAIADVDFTGNVHPDQFSMNHTVGNIRAKPFSEIWRSDVPLLADLRRRKELLHGRCATCQWLPVCNGNLRVRAEAATGDYWASDPACYLTDEEIASSPLAQQQPAAGAGVAGE